MMMMMIRNDYDTYFIRVCIVIATHMYTHDVHSYKLCDLQIFSAHSANYEYFGLSGRRCGRRVPGVPAAGADRVETDQRRRGPLLRHLGGLGRLQRHLGHANFL